MMEFVKYIKHIIDENLESYKIRSYWEYEMYRIANVKMLPKNVSIHITYQGDYNISLELDEYPINICIYIGKIYKNGDNSIEYNYDKVVYNIINYKEINKNKTNFEPFKKINYNTYQCGNIIFCNNNGRLMFSVDKKITIINKINDIIINVPEIYKYQIIKDQKLAIQ